MARIRFFLLMMFVLQIAGTVSVFSQSTVKYEREIAGVSSDSTYYLSPWTLPESIQVFANNTLIDSTYWRFEKLTGAWHLTPKFSSAYRSVNSIQIVYEAFPFTIPRLYQPRKPIKLDAHFFDNPDSLRDKLSSRQPKSSFTESNIRQSGSLSRGIIVGSNQDFALESGLNFELTGALTENINITASLTDKSIPIQPDGTTQNLREFDKVFIQVQAPRTTVEMGDVDISLTQSTFAQLNRRLQGAAGYVKSNTGQYLGAASVVRGTYKSMSFSGADGVQGPYRLRGDNNSEFVIVLAGTERVYLNGQQVQRGADNDYIIDYGLGEVTFTNNVLIKDETRIVIEYEYINQDFNRTLASAEAQEELFDGRLKIGVTAIRQADGNDLLSQQSLTREDINLLKSVGDDIDQAVVSGARVATEEERKRFVLYAQVDTTVQAEIYTIYKIMPGSEQAKYRVQFTNVGESEGAYRRSSGNVNGLQYEWVGPGQGSYAPFRQLPAPQKQQMAAVYGNYALGKHVELFGEWAVSDFDVNRFSSMDNDDNTDMAYEAGLRMKKMNTSIGELRAAFKRRYSGDQFAFFERTRDVEFDRKWNITRSESGREEVNSGTLGYHPTEQTELNAELGWIERPQFSGVRQAAHLSSSEENILDVNYQQDWVQSEDEALQQDGNWFRQNGRLSKSVGLNELKITPYFSFEQEHRIQKNILTDSLSHLSRQFYDLQPGVSFEWEKLQLDASVAYRKEKDVIENRLKDASTALEQIIGITYRPGAHFSTENQLRLHNKTYEKIFEAQGSRNRKGLLIKSFTRYSTPNEFIDGEFFYETNTQRQALFQETYIEVGPEIGQYVWEDLNGDNTRQIDEFFLEVSPNEGTYIRQFLPSDELMPVIDLHARLLNTIKPFTAMGENHWLADVQLRSRIDIAENSTTSALEDVYLLKLQTFRSDSTTLSGRLLWEKELDLLSGVNRADLRIGYSENQSFNRRSSEALKKNVNRWYLNTAFKLTERTQISLEIQKNINQSKSNRLQNRNFNISEAQIKPGISATINRNWNAGLELSYAHKEDRYPAQQVEASLWKIATRHRTYLFSRLQTNMRLEYRNTSIEGNASRYGSYELTEGTGEGGHVLWNLNSTYRANNLIRFSLNYDGRTSSDRPAIHTIKLVMSATF